MKIMVELDGETIPLSKLFWVRYDPDGCVVGSMLGDCATSPSQAHKEFTSRADVRKREAIAGYRHELVTRETWNEVARDCMMGRCKHRTGPCGEFPLF